VLILLGLIAMFGVVELRKASNEDDIRQIFSDPVPVLANKIHLLLLHTRVEFEQYREAKDKNEKSWENVKSAIEATLIQVEALRTILFKNSFEAEEHQNEQQYIFAIRTDIERFETLKPPETDEESQVARGMLDELGETAHKLVSSIEQSHKTVIDKLFKQIDRDERDRVILVIVMLMGGFVVVLFLFDLVYHYKTNAERARAAEKYNALFAAALQNTRVGVLIRDMRRENRPVVFINKAFTRITGYEFSDLTGNSSEFLFGWNSGQDSISAFRRAINSLDTTLLDVLLYRKDGSPFWSEWHLTPIKGDDGKPAYFVSLFNDVTAIKQAQEELVQAKEMAEHASAVKTSFLAMMSHEIRTPINGILGVLRLIEETKLDDEQKHLMGIAMTSSSALHGIINDILDYAKMEAGKIEIITEPFDLKSLVGDVLSLARPLLGKKKIEVMADIDSTIPGRLVGDAGRIRQILLNLVSNATKFTDEGFIKVRVFPIMQQEIEGKPGFLMRFEVQDSGIGISDADQGKLFQEFSQIERSFTRRFGGTGLGLAICRRLLTMMQGEIDVESMPGKGSKFWFMLPIQEVCATDMDPLLMSEHMASLPLSQGELEKYKVLIVEDNDTNRLVARRYIEKIGLSVDEATNGLEAIDKVKTQKYDVILMDVSMPEMDGMMATCHIRALGGHYAKVPVLALTAHAMQGDRQLCLAAGMNDYLNKPIEYHQLIQAFQRWLRIGVIRENRAALQPQSSPDTEPTPLIEEAMAGSPLSSYSHYPLFEPRVLTDMQNNLGGDVVDQVTSVFLEDSAKRVTGLAPGSLANTIQDLAHTLKSCSANCGLVQFSKMMEDLELAASAGNHEKMENLLTFAQDIYDQSRRMLEREKQNYLN